MTTTHVSNKPSEAVYNGLWIAVSGILCGADFMTAFFKIKDGDDPTFWFVLATLVSLVIAARCWILYSYANIQWQRGWLAGWNEK